MTSGARFLKETLFVAILGICLSAGLSIRFVGRLFLADLILPIALCATLLWPATRNCLRLHWRESVLLLSFPMVGLAWDWMNQSDPALYLRGFSRNLVFVSGAVSAMAIVSRIEHWRTLVVFLALALATPIAALVQSVNGLEDAAFIKYFGGWALLLPAVMILSRLSPPLVSGAIMMLAGCVVGFGLSLRSFGGVLVLAGFFTTTARWWARVPRGAAFTTVLLLPIVVAGAAINILQSDHVPAELRANWEASNFQRLDMAIDAWKGFLESPLLGNGSWAHALRYTEISQPGMLVGVHSFILQFAFEYGLYGLIFGAWLLWIGVGGVVDFMHSDRPDDVRWLPVYLLLMLNFVYAVLMSPMGGYERVLAGIALGIALEQLGRRSRYRAQ